MNARMNGGKNQKLVWFGLVWFSSVQCFGFSSIQVWFGLVKCLNFEIFNFERNKKKK